MNSMKYAYEQCGMDSSGNPTASQSHRCFTGRSRLTMVFDQALGGSENWIMLLRLIFVARLDHVVRNSSHVILFQSYQLVLVYCIWLVLWLLSPGTDEDGARTQGEKMIAGLLMTEDWRWSFGIGHIGWFRADQWLCVTPGLRHGW